MNLAQIRSAVRDILSAGGGSNAVVSIDSFWADAEINQYINFAQDELFKVIRRARADYFTRIIRTTDVPLMIAGHLFDPATLRWVAGTGNYVLPPDFTRIKLITDLSDDPVRIVASDIARAAFKGVMQSTGGGVAREYLYDVLGIRNLILRPVPQEVRDLEFIYEKRLPRLRDWSNGTCSVINGNNTATFSVTTNLLDRVVVGSELLVATGSVLPTPDPTEVYPVIKSIDSNTQVTLESVYINPTASDKLFYISPVSEIPEHHHQLLVAYAVILAFKKGTNPHSDSVQQWLDVYNSMLPSLISDVEIRQGSDIETVEAYLEDGVDA